MIVNLPICYHAEVPTRLGRIVHRKLLKAVAFDICELHPDEFEVSATNLDVGSNVTVDAIWHDGSNWIREATSMSGTDQTYMGKAKFDPNDPGCILSLVSGRAWERCLLGADGIGKEEMKRWHGEWLASGMPRESRFSATPARTSTLEKELQRVGDFLNDVRIVDGYLHCRIPVPFYRITKGFKAEIALDGKPGLWGGFRLDRHDDLVSHMREHCGSALEGVSNRPRILLPEAFEWDDEALSFQAVVREARRFCMGEGRYMNEEARAVNDSLMAAIRKADRGHDPDMAELANELDGFSDYHRHHRGRMTREVARAGWSVMLAAKAAAARWRLRPIDMAEDGEAVRAGGPSR